MTKRRATTSVRTAINATGDAAPEWVQVLPAGPELVGRDGRSWQLVDAATVVADSLAKGPLHIDYEHASEKKGPKGEEAPAAAWINDLEVREGAIWARVEWTPRAAQMISAREYRFLSPVFMFDTDTRRVLYLVSAGLTNQPNLDMTALNRAELDDDNPKESSMNPEQIKALCRSLGISETSTAEAIQSAVDALKTDKAAALNRAETPSLDKFVPRADYDAALNRASTAETAINTMKTTQREGEISALVDGAVSAGKIAPASKDFYLGMCRNGGENAVGEFKKFIESAPVLTGAVLDGKKVPASNDGALAEDEKAACRAMGISEDDFKKAKAA